MAAQNWQVGSESTPAAERRRNRTIRRPATASWSALGVPAPIIFRRSKARLQAAAYRPDREGLVLEPQNAREPLFVCCCCGCCCGVLTTAKKLPRPADFFQTDFVAEVDPDTCQVCGMCGIRCQMDAIASGDEVAKVAAERCIGCGLCVTTCPSGAVRLHRKEGKKPPPKNTQALYETIFQERFGRLGATVAVVGHLVGRKF